MEKLPDHDQVEFQFQVNEEKDENKLKTINRLLLSKILSADASQYLSQKQFESLNSRFISESPEIGMIEVTYKENSNNRTSYYDVICCMNVNLQPGKFELQDPYGNVWISYSLVVSFKTGASYGCEFEEFRSRADCMEKVKTLAQELFEMIPQPVKVMKFTNEQRIEHEKRTSYENNVSLLKDIFMFSNARKMRMGLRKNGNCRHVDREHVANVAPGIYVFTLNDGSGRRPQNKKFELKIYEEAGQPALIRRLEA